MGMGMGMGMGAAGVPPEPELAPAAFPGGAGSGSLRRSSKRRARAFGEPQARPPIPLVTSGGEAEARGGFP